MGILYGLISSATFGLIPLFTLPLVAAGVPVETALVYRFAIATAALWLILKCLGESLAIPKRAFFKICALSLFYMLAVLLFFKALNFLASGMVATLQFQFPVMVMLIMIIFFHEPFRWRTALALFLAISGVTLLSLSPDLAPAKIDNGYSLGSSLIIGVILSLATGFFNALYFVGLQVTKLPKINGLVMTFYIMLFGAIFCFFNALFTNSLQWLNTWPELLNAFLLAIVTAVISNITLILAIRRVGSTITSILDVMEPLTALACGCIVFGEPFTKQLAAGVVLIIASVMVVLLRKQTPAK